MGKKEYIERGALLSELCGDDPSRMEDYYYNAIKNAPSADVAEVVHGEWVKTKKGRKCSQCNCLSALFDQNLLSCFCPWCGAKMDGERKE